MKRKGGRRVSTLLNAFHACLRPALNRTKNEATSNACDVLRPCGSRLRFGSKYSRTHSLAHPPAPVPTALLLPVCREPIRVLPQGSPSEDVVADGGEVRVSPERPRLAPHPNGAAADRMRDDSGVGA